MWPRRNPSHSRPRVANDLRRADDGLGPMQFGYVDSPPQEPRERAMSWLVAILSGGFGLVIVVAGLGVILIKGLTVFEPCTAISSRPTPWAMLGLAVWTACALLAPVLASGNRRNIGWVCGGLAAVIPALALGYGIISWVTPETFSPTWCF